MFMRSRIFPVGAASRTGSGPLRLGALVVALATALAAPPPPAVAGPPTTCRGLQGTIVGTPGADRLVGTPDRDVIVGLAGRDLLLGRGGDDLICGGSGADRMRGGWGDDELADRDVTADRMRGGKGDDLVWDRWTLSDQQLAFGGPGRDQLTVYDGYHVGDRPVIVRTTINLTRGLARVPRFDVAFPVLGFEGTDPQLHGPLSYVGTQESDSLDGNNRSGPLDVWTLGGNDLVSGSPYADRLHGGGGNDLVQDMWVLSSSRQVADGGPGQDRLIASESWLITVPLTRVVIDQRRGIAQVPSRAVEFPVTGVEELESLLPSLTWFGTDGPDLLAARSAGDAEHDVLLARGLDGDDLISGTDFGDVIDAGPGDDEVLGWSGDDEVDGGPGNDRLDGWDGDDILNGGLGHDAAHGGDGDDACPAVERPVACERSSGDQ